MGEVSSVKRRQRLAVCSLSAQNSLLGSRGCLCETFEKKNYARPVQTRSVSGLLDHIGPEELWGQIFRFHLHPRRLIRTASFFLQTSWIVGTIISSGGKLLNFPFVKLHCCTNGSRLIWLQVVRPMFMRSKQICVCIDLRKRAFSSACKAHFTRRVLDLPGENACSDCRATSPNCGPF